MTTDLFFGGVSFKVIFRDIGHYGEDSLACLLACFDYRGSGKIDLIGDAMQNWCGFLILNRSTFSM
jgi:hypothetical protein